MRNFTHSSNYIFGTNMFGEETQYYIQNCVLPGLSLGHIQTSKSSQNLYFQGDTIEFNPLEIDFLLDEKLEVWKEVIAKMFKAREQKEGTGKPIQGTSWLIVQDDNAKNLLKVVFYNSIIESFGDVQFSSTSEDGIITFPVTVLYDYYEIEPV